jgi:predicted short-subunit dehydrogenase-like oxidoreductase (DUF2520 family)
MPVPEVLAGADLVLLTVPDDVLPGLVRGLAETGAVKPGQFLAHASGRFGYSVLDPATAVGGLPLALHPVMTFTGTSVDLPRLTGVPFGVTAPDQLRRQALVVEMGGDPVCGGGHRVLYHAALAHGSNHLVTLEAQGSDHARRGRRHPARLVAPLLSAALDNVLRYGDQALTGPVARGDAGTVAAHLEQIAAVSPETRTTYVALARATADRALANGMLRADAAERLLDVLAGREDAP